MADVPFLRRVRIRNYKSIAECDVELGRFTVLVGRNGSGKSNFLDAIAFLSDSLNTSIFDAVKKRGGMRSVTPRSAREHTPRIDLAVEFELDEVTRAEYSLSFSEEGLLPADRRERLLVFRQSGPKQAILDSCDGQASSDVLDLKNVRFPSHELVLPRLTGSDLAVRVFEALRLFRVYDPQPRKLRNPVGITDVILDRDGENTASVMWRLQSLEGGIDSRLVDFLSAAVDEVGCLSVRPERAERAGDSSKVKLVFYFDREAGWEPFDHREVSDGTLRATAVLLAAMQRQADGRPVPVVGIEEPEVGLHPAANAAIIEGLREASLTSQVIVTTHSPDFLDALDVEHDTLLVARRDRAGTVIGPPGEANRSVLRDHLYSAGELLRMNHLEPACPGRGPDAVPTA